MRDMVWIDIEREVGPVGQRKNRPFHKFIYDAIIMQKGLQTIAVKTLYQMTNGLAVYKLEPFAQILNKTLGLSSDPFRLDSIQVVLRSHLFFKMIQSEWI